MSLPDFYQLASDQSQWSQQTFGTDSERGPVGPLKHLAKEVQECLANPSDPKEYADCLILILDASRRAGFSADVLVATAQAKMLENKSREWPKSTDPNAPVEHVRETDGWQIIRNPPVDMVVETTDEFRWEQYEYPFAPVLLKGTVLELFRVNTGLQIRRRLPLPADFDCVPEVQ